MRLVVLMLGLVACTATQDTGPDASGHDAGPLIDASALDTSLDINTLEAGDVTTEDAATLVPNGPTGSWSLVFDDEFSGTALDPTKWNSGWYTSGVNASSAPVSSGELEYYSPEAIVFPGDGAVHLRLSTSTSNAYGKGYQSGMIQSPNPFTFDPTMKTTTLEARLRVPGPQASSAGYWPAFWLLSNEDANGGTGQWPPEIDIFELFGDADSAIAHFHTTGGDINYPETDSTGTDLSLAFHVYTIEISPTVITFYLDGAEKWTYTDQAHIAALLDYPPLYVLLCFQLGGAGGGATNGQTQIPNDMVIDYVRAWTQ